ncbi:hypothetical protein D9M71_717900 [compost metagenome]
MWREGGDANMADPVVERLVLCRRAVHRVVYHGELPVHQEGVERTGPSQAEMAEYGQYVANDYATSGSNQQQQDRGRDRRYPVERSDGGLLCRRDGESSQGIVIVCHGSFLIANGLRLRSVPS